MKKNIKVAPSILAGDFGYLADAAKRIADSGADAIHLDIMDGHFVPNITMGPQAVAAVNRATDLFLDVHLMIYNPFDYVERFVAAGADRITFHLEATEDVQDTLDFIKRCNIQAGLAFNPETSMSLIPKYLDRCDMVLLMTVHPGFGGQEFIPKVLEKIKFTRDVCTKLNIPMEIEVDGGINPETAKKCIENGANILVAGTYVFESKDMHEAVQKLRNAANN